MPSQRQNMVNNIPAAGESASGGSGAVGRDSHTLKSCFPNSPLYTPSPGGISGGAGFDDESKLFYEQKVLDGVRPFGYGISNFDADYADAPNISDVPYLTTTDGKLAKETIAAAKVVGGGPLGADLIWPIPKPADLGGGGQVYEFDNADPGYGSGEGNDGTTSNPDYTSKHIASENPLNPATYGTST
tara:strand:+ start:437 stop:997 length:561 start_codon:yes stop_codon:yes gene_type:complete